jgi:RNA polymerase subunit RPABC4/transcription elongation factor Spt4
MTVAYFGINDSSVNLVINLIILILVVIWLALVYWTYTDARRRIEDPLLVWCATAASLFPIVGTFVYMIVRPPEYIEDARERELEMQASEARLAQLNQHFCPHCDYQIDREMLTCPNCLHKLKEACVHCGKPLEQTWSICPYCENAVPGALPPRTRSRRRREPEYQDTLGEPIAPEASSS